MTSSRPTECFVYITPPGARAAATPGRFILESRIASEFKTAGAGEDLSSA
jgi:hypothetical protein